MKKQNFKELFKNKGVYVTLFIAALMIVTALSMNKNRTGSESGENNLVDLNESPGIMAEDKKGTQIADNSTGNDFLLEYDNYEGGKIANITPFIPSQGEQAGINKAEDTLSQAVGGTAVAKEPKTQGSETAKTENEKTGDKDAQAQVKESETAVSLTVADLKFKAEDGLSWPVKGNVILGYSPNHGIYHATLMQFKTNPAVLISCEEGTEIKASAKGIITDITNDIRTGVTITMAVGDDYSLVYGQLAETECQIGDIIEQGQVFAKVGKATKYYSVEGSHLYFQVYSGVETTNPMLLLKE